MAREWECKDRGARQELAERSAKHREPGHGHGGRSGRVPWNSALQQHLAQVIPRGFPGTRVQSLQITFPFPFLRLFGIAEPTEGKGTEPAGHGTHALCPAAAPRAALSRGFGPKSPNAPGSMGGHGSPEPPGPAPLPRAPSAALPCYRRCRGAGWAPGWGRRRRPRREPGAGPGRAGSRAPPPATC